MAFLFTNWVDVVGAEIAKTLPIVPSFIGKPLAVTVKMLLEDGYPDATQSRLVPDIRNFLDPVTLKSATETRNNSEAVVVEQFKESIAKNSAPIDKRDKSKGNNAGFGGIMELNIKKITREAILDGRVPVLGIHLDGENYVILLEDDYLELRDKLRNA